MIRSLTAAAMLAALAALAAQSASAATAASAPAAKKSTKKAAPKPPADAEPTSAPNDTLDPGQLTAADRVLTGKAACELKQFVDIEKLDGHTGNFKLVFDHKSYIMVPEETTTGAVRLVDTGGAVVWVQIPHKSMLMNQKVHQRLVDGCQEDEQRIAEQAAAQAAANAPVLAPSVAGLGNPAASAAEAATGTAPAAPVLSTAPNAAPAATQTTTTTTTTTTVKIIPPAAVPRLATAPDAASAGMFK